MRTLIKNGTCVTASDTFAADVWIDNGKIAALVAPGTKLGKRRSQDDRRQGQVRHPRRHRRAHAPRHAVRRHQLDRRLRVGHAGGGARRHHHASSTSPSRRRAARCARRSTPGTPRPRASALVDYAFHMIATDVPPPVLDEMGAMVREGVTSFKMFMAYPGVLLLDDQSIFRAMLRAGELGALICMHAETGLPIDVLVERAINAGHTAPIYHALTRPEVAEATGTERAIALAEMAKVPVYIVHLSAQRALERVMEARDRGLPAYAETCPQYLFLSEDDLRGKPRRSEFEGAKYVCTPPLRPKHHHDHLWRGLRQPRPAGRLDGPLPVLHEGAEGARQGRLLEDPERHAGHRDAPAPAVRRRARQAHLAQPLRRDHARRRRRRSSACTARRAPSPSAPTPTWWSGIRRSASSSRTRTCT